MGGKVGGRITREKKMGIHNPHNQKLGASLGGKSHTGKWWVFLPFAKKKTRILPEKYPDYFEQGWIKGMGASRS